MGKQSGESQQLQDAQTSLANVMASTGKQSAQEGSTLFNLALPGLQQTESYYGKLAGGDPSALARANAPAIQSISKSTESAKRNILQDMPRGGERNLALEEADLSKGAQISGLTTGSYLGAFPSLASLGGQNVSQGTAATGTGLQGMNAAANQYGQLQQLQNEQKATQLGFISSLAGAGATLGAGLCWVASECFGGWNNYRTKAVRWYFESILQHHWLGKWAYLTYRTYGQRWAEYIRSHSTWKKLTVAVFIRIYQRAEKIMAGVEA